MAVLAKLKFFFAAFVCLAPLSAAVLTNGSELEVRLLECVGSRISHVGDHVQAVVITPVLDHGRILIPTGAIVSGLVDHLDRLGLGLRHTAARLDLKFTQLRLADGTTVPIDARVASVEEAREVVSDTGAVIGIHPSASFSTGVSGVFTAVSIGEPEFRLPILGFKFLAARSPDAEITFPAGTEMLLRLSRDAQLQRLAGSRVAIPLLDPPQRAQVQNLLAELPEQSLDGKHPSDLINIAVVGTQEAIERAFRAAGWSGTEAHGVMALYHMYRCMVQRAGYSRAPMTDLTLNGNPPNAAFQKNLDTFAKRHHVRLWRDQQSGVWLGAATEDVKFTVRALHMTHATDPHVDNERAKIVNDLVFTGCVDRGVLLPRANLKPAREDSHSILTDGDVAVLQLNACDSPRVMPPNPQPPKPVRAVRVAVAVSEDIARSNPVSVGYAMVKAMFDSSATQPNKAAHQCDTYTRAIAISSVPRDGAGKVLALR